VGHQPSPHKTPATRDQHSHIDDATRPLAAQPERVERAALPFVHFEPSPTTAARQEGSAKTDGVSIYHAAGIDCGRAVVGTRLKPKD
jgi:hypothetical protein